MAVPKKEGIKHSDFQTSVTKSLNTGHFVVTSACAGAVANKPFLSALESYCKLHRAKLLILPMRAHRQFLENQPDFYDTVFEKYIEAGQMIGHFRFNANLEARDFHLNPQQRVPLTGLDTLQGPSLIVAHPQMHMKLLATGNRQSHSRMLTTTGVCTNPDYQVNRLGTLADLDHNIAALSIQLDGDIFHMRQLIADTDNSFVDLGQRYHSNGTTSSECATAIVLGDLHPGQHDPGAIAFGLGLIEMFKPAAVFCHDSFNGHSISHHFDKHTVTKAREFVTLKHELHVTKEILDAIRLKAGAGKTMIVASNHDQWLDRWVEEGRYLKEPQNFKLGLAAAWAMSEGNSPLRTLIDAENQLHWLSRNEDLHIDGVNLACHGDAGTNGAKGSAGGFAKTHGKMTHGHTHTSSINRGVWSVGTSSLLRMGYNTGASTWDHCHCIQYKGGLRQLVRLVDGRCGFPMKKPG